MKPLQVAAGLWTMLALAGAVGAATPAAEAEPASDFQEVTLSNGMSVGWGMVRLGGSEAPLPLEGHVILRGNAATRLVVDSATGASFGYRLSTTTLTGYASPTMMVLRVEILPLAAVDEKDLRRIDACEGCPSLRLVAATIRYPPRQFVRDGDTMMIDLLEHPKTGEKIVDFVKFSSDTVAREHLDTLRDRVRTASRHTRRGDELAAKGAYADAAAEYAKAAPLQRDAAVHRKLGHTYLKIGRADVAQRELEIAVRLNPADIDTRHLLSVVRHRRGDFGKALSGYREVLKQRPEWALARRNLATAHLDRGSLGEAVQEYRHAHRSDPTILETKDAARVKARDGGLELYAIAKVYLVEGDANAALAALARAFEAGFDDSQRVRDDADFAPLLKDPRLVGMLARAARS